MAIAISISDNSAIPDEIRRAILQLEPEFPGDWRATLIAPQDHSHWELKLADARGVIRRGKIDLEHQNPEDVHACLRKLGGEIEAGR